jgi:hypothetical protein
MKIDIEKSLDEYQNIEDKLEKLKYANNLKKEIDQLPENEKILIQEQVKAVLNEISTEVKEFYL